MQLIVSNNRRNVVLDPLSGCPTCIPLHWTYTRCGCDLWEIAGTQTSSARPPNEIICGMLVDICCLLACCFDDFKDGIDLESVVRILEGTFPINNDLREVSWIDATTEELGGVVVQILGRIGCGKISAYCSIHAVMRILL